MKNFSKVADGGKTRTFLFSMETPSMSPPISPCVRDDANYGVKDDKQSSPRSPKPTLNLKDDKQSSPRTSIPKLNSKDDANLGVRDDANLSVVEKRRQMSLDGATDLASITSSCDALKMKTELPGKKLFRLLTDNKNVWPDKQPSFLLFSEIVIC